MRATSVVEQKRIPAYHHRHRHHPKCSGFETSFERNTPNPFAPAAIFWGMYYKPYLLLGHSYEYFSEHFATDLGKYLQLTNVSFSLSSLLWAREKR